MNIEAEPISSSVLLFALFPNGFIGETWLPAIQTAEALAGHNVSGLATIPPKSRKRRAERIIAGQLVSDARLPSKIQKILAPISAPIRLYFPLTRARLVSRKRVDLHAL